MVSIALQAGISLHGVDETDLQSKLRDLVRHIRDRKLRMTFTDALGQASTCTKQRTDYKSCFVTFGGYALTCRTW